MIRKIVEPTGDLCIKFTDEEMSAIGIKAGDKFSYEECEDGILLKKYASIDLDLSEFSRETLEFLVSESIEKDITVSECIESIIEKNIGIDAQQSQDTL